MPDPADPASRFERLDDEQIRDQTDSGSFSRGRSYFRNGHILNPTLRGDTIEAQCIGSEPTPYHVSATLAPAGQRLDNPLRYDCSCPRGGFCKHIVALLLAWVHTPDRFGERPPLAEQLAGRSPEELAALIERMVARYPDLERLVDLPMPVIPDLDEGVAASAVTVDGNAIRRQVRAAFANIDVYDPWDFYEREVAPYIVSEIQPLVAYGRRLAGAGQWANAEVVLAAIAQELVEETDPEYFNGDHEGALIGLIAETGEGLVEVLEAQQGLPENQRLPADLREDLVRTLYDLWIYDVFDTGGLGIAAEYAGVLVRATTPEERATIETWLRAESTPDPWYTRAVIGFIALMREEDGATLEEILPLYRDAELWEDVVLINLDLDRIDEATSVARRHIRNPVILQRIADALVNHGGDAASRALPLVDDLLWEIEGTDPHAEALLEEWLMRRYLALDQPGKALEMAQRIFRRSPGPQVFQNVRAIAEMPGQPEGTWERIRPGLFEHLQGVTQLPVLIQTLLAEGDAAGALQAFQRLASQKPGPGTAFHPYYWVESLAPQVAVAAAETHPDEAIAIWRDLADGRIERRNRNAYQQAAEHLVNVKATFEAHGREQEWRAFIADLRERHKTLRALRAELDARDLD